jgi:hypothetical protein
MDEEIFSQPIIDESDLDQLITISEIGEELDEILDAIINQFSQLDVKYQALLKTRKHHLNGY